jgi:hypothetical protein
VKHHPVVVVSSREATLADVLPRLGEGADRALRDGRVFVGARRASSAAERVAAGDEVVMYASRVRGSDAPRILLQRQGIVAAYKPADIATVADHRGRTGTLEDDIAKELALSPDELVATSRLDVGVSGVVLFATDEASHPVAPPPPPPPAISSRSPTVLPPDRTSDAPPPVPPPTAPPAPASLNVLPSPPTYTKSVAPPVTALFSRSGEAQSLFLRAHGTCRLRSRGGTATADRRG